MSESTSGEEVRTLGRYRVIAKLGQGGMAKVFLTVVPGPAGVQKLLVVKELRPEIAHDEDVRTMFLDEARLAARLNHPHVVQTYEVGEERGHYFIAMEYLEGQPLNRLWRRMAAERMPLEMQLRILCDTLAGLHYAHELTDFDGTPLHVVHRDVSPHNVFVTYDGQVKVVDFGIAKAASSRGATKNGIFKGKVTYASPEQAMGAPIDRRSDIFSCGIMLWEALTQQRMWGKKPEVAVLLALSNGEYVSPRTVAHDVPPELDAITMRALAHAPEERFATAADFQHALEDYLERSPVRVSARQIGQFVTEQFADERSRIRESVDAQIRRMATGTGAVPAAIPTLLEEDRDPSTPAGNSERTADPAVVATFASGASGGTGMQAVATPSAGGTRMIVAIGVAAVSLAALAFVALRPAPSAPPHEAAAAPAPAPAPTPAPSDDDATIAVSIRATPPAAQLFLDDVALATNPFDSKMPKDGRAHHVRASAAGYVSTEEVVSFDAPLKVVLALKRVTAAAPPPVRPAPPAKSEPEVRPTKPKRSVDETDPYAR